MGSKLYLHIFIFKTLRFISGLEKFTSSHQIALLIGDEKKAGAQNQSACPIDKYLEHLFLFFIVYVFRLQVYDKSVRVTLYFSFFFDLSIYRSILNLKEILTCNIAYNSSLLNNGKLHFKIFCEQVYKICIL